MEPQSNQQKEQLAWLCAQKKILDRDRIKTIGEGLKALGLSSFAEALLAEEILPITGPPRYDRVTRIDPEMARAVGVPVHRWDRMLAVWLGITVAFSMHVAGLLYTFGCLVLPALVAKNVCREVRPMLWVAPTVAAYSARDVALG